VALLQLREFSKEESKQLISKQTEFPLPPLGINQYLRDRIRIFLIYNYLSKFLQQLELCVKIIIWKYRQLLLNLDSVKHM